MLLLAMVLLGLLAAWWQVRASLPVLDGEIALPGLSAPVSIQRDALGTATIEAGNEADAMRALGYLHAQERYFEMDLLRRSAAGELSELFGSRALEADRAIRIHRMRARVERELENIAGGERAVLRAYVDGVNAGLAGLDSRPWPYLLLRQAPRSWALEDSPLVSLAMYFDLQDERNRRELALWEIEPHLPAELFRLLARNGSPWDAPLADRARPEAELPTAEQVDLRRLPAPEATAAPGQTRRAIPPEVGSNSFAVSGARTRDGRAILADDMHLGLRAPNIWFRARLRYPDPDSPGQRIDINGFTLPGVPGVVVGSNGHVAWGFTNSYIDTADWALVRPCGSRATAAASVCTPVRTMRETIAVAGAQSVSIDVAETAWGPILHRRPDGNALALRWAAHLPGAINFGLIDFGKSTDIKQALSRADRAAIPTQNLLVADASGRIAWRWLGPIPQRRAGCRADRPQPVAGDCPPWPLASDRSPAILEPASGRLWTANNRIVDGPALVAAGDGGYALGARARQIRDSLFLREEFSEEDLLAIQLDDRAVFLRRWWELMREQAGNHPTPALGELSGASATWQGRASEDSTSYRLVRAWRQAVLDRIAKGLTAPARVALGEDFDMPRLPHLEGVAWPLVTQRPAHLLPRAFASWDALLEDAAAETLGHFQGQGPLAQRTWGERNTAAICHPLAGAIPVLGKRLLCMPPDALSGDLDMPKVVGPDMGASQRMVVSPGHEADGIIHMPGGQSGHPMSPFWGAGHDDWVQGRPTPFLPGEARHALTLTP
ncbi:penicillin acylase family protein [Luteimonas vadosa]|uniref:Penicillin acylase family protein n=2 Tax=Luteimonas vadosa TaxID=1165507 RepID=A0ABP9E5B8_9GAMM